MSIIRIQKDKDNPYVMVDKRALGDVRLSWKAKGILAYLLSLPDDWKIYISELMTHAPDKETSLRSGLAELEKFGYMRKEQERRQDGKIAGYDWSVFEHPEATVCGKSTYGKSTYGKSTTTNNNKTNNNKTNIVNTPHGLMVEALRVVTGMDIKIKANAGRIVRASKELLGAGYTHEDVDRFGSLWKEDWRYRQDNRPPALTTLLAEIAKVKEVKSELSPEQRKELALKEIEKAGNNV